MLGIFQCVGNEEGLDILKEEINSVRAINRRK
jgi:hypothetical protein